MKAAYTRYILDFKTPGGTSRGVLTQKETWFIRIWHDETPWIFGVGECALFRGLSADDCPGYEEKLREVCEQIDTLDTVSLREWSSIRFGVETALLDLKNGGKRRICPGTFYDGKQAIEINGLIWMGNKETMYRRIEEKLAAGFHCVKLKIGAIDFNSELELLKSIRSRYGKDEIELRVDANGAFSPVEAMCKLDKLSRYDIHSIEQPIRQGQWPEMEILCRDTPIPIALDEELIGINEPEQKEQMLNAIKPQYIILKPALAGGLSGSAEWIDKAEKQGIGWWITSALESNVGLNAIAQWTATLQPCIPQGLGTGQLYTNNIVSPLVQKGSVIQYDPSLNWDLSALIWK
ncbi:o-succinylbenzoate synthase [Coprobacter sp.]